MYKIPEPCHERWDEMTPQEQGRHCAQCDKVVVDFTKMSQVEAENMLSEAAAKHDNCQTGICGRVHSDAQGQITFGRKRLLTDAMAAMLAMSLLGGCQQEPELIIGEVAPVEAEPNSIETPAVDPHRHPVEDPSKILLGDICIDPSPDNKPDAPAIPEPTVKGEIHAVEIGEVIVEHPQKMGKIYVAPKTEEPSVEAAASEQKP